MDLLDFFNVAPQKNLILAFVLVALILILPLVKFRQKICQFYEDNERVILIVLIVALLIFQLLFIFSFSINSDDRFHLHSAYLTSLGKKPYQDFFTHHMIGYYFTLSPLFWIMGNSPDIIIASRMISVIFTIIILFFVYLLSRMYYSKRISLYAVLFTLLFREFFMSSFTIRADAISSALFLFGTYLFLLYDKNEGYKKYLVYSGILMFLSFFFLQKASISIVMLFFGIFTLRKIKGKKIIFDALLFLVPSLLLLASFFIFMHYYLSQKGFDYFLKLLFIFNSKVSFNNPIMHNLITIFLVNGVFFLLLFYALFSNTRKKIDGGLLIVLASFLPLIYFMLSRKMLGSQYFIAFIPLFSIISSLGLESLRNKINRKFIFLIIVIILIVLPLFSFAIDFNRGFGLKRDISELKKFNEIYSPQDKIYDKGYFIFHDNLEYFDFGFDYQSLLKSIGITEEFDGQKIISKNSPRFIRLDNESVPPKYSALGIDSLYKRI